MSVLQRNAIFYCAFRPLGKLVWLSLPHANTPRQAKILELQILEAIRTKDFSRLDAQGREATIRFFVNQGYKVPDELGYEQYIRETTLSEAIESFLKSGHLAAVKDKKRYSQALEHITAFFGADTPIKGIWIPELRRYRLHRQTKGAANATINKEVSCLSKVFQVQIENKTLEANPCRNLERLSEKSGQREIYISWDDFNQILSNCNDWLKPIVVTAYYTGMRRGEILNLRRSDIQDRIITLKPDQTKEARSKRIPIHKDLLTYLSRTHIVSSIKSNNYFLSYGRPITPNIIRRPWEKAVKELDYPFNFHDLRHAWIANARRSGLTEHVINAVTGHYDRLRPVTERYGRISDDELIGQIDKLTFDHGRSEYITVNGVS